MTVRPSVTEISTLPRISELPILGLKCNLLPVLVNFVVVNSLFQIAPPALSRPERVDAFAEVDLFLISSTVCDSFRQAVTRRDSSPGSISKNPRLPVNGKDNNQSSYTLGALRPANTIATESPGGAVPGSRGDFSDHASPGILVDGFRVEQPRNP